MRGEDLPDHITERIVFIHTSPEPPLRASVNQAFIPAIGANEHNVAGFNEEGAQRR
ncbi:hypothetical protein A7982_12149 [Minicystis rosea]|nr:hypothetical protein A7982_12149 [Minicystis rosea]